MSFREDVKEGTDLRKPFLHTGSWYRMGSRQSSVLGSSQTVRDSSVSVLLCVLIVALGPLQFGFTCGHSSPTQSAIISDLRLTVSEVNQMLQAAQKCQSTIAESGSLLIIPKVLVVNAAKDSTDFVAKLRANHYMAQTNASKKHLSSIGLDLYKGIVRDNFEAGVIEPAMSKVKIIQSSKEYLEKQIGEVESNLRELCISGKDRSC